MAPCASHVLPPRIQIPEIVVTNTLIVTNLSREAFLPENLAELRDRLERHGKIYKMVPIKSFLRILAIFYQTNDAKNAKRFCDRGELLNKTLRIYYGQHTPLYDEVDNSRHLSVPELEKNWLVSPPCSPPVGWTQIKEDRPNSNTLADDLVHALAHGSLNTNIANYYKNHDIDDFSLNDNSHQDNNDRKQIPTLTVVPCDLNSNRSDTKVPLILVQDWDDSESRDTKKTKTRNFNIQQTKAQLYPTLVQRTPTPTPTPRPPLIFS
jgi:hypothetical protein